MATLTSTPAVADDPTGAAGAAAGPPFDLAGAWALSPQVALRPERFGALAYHFGTRRLSFLKSPRLLAVVEALADHPSADAACDAVALAPAERPGVAQALAVLARTDMIVPRSPA